MEETSLKQGDQVPGHVVVLIGVEASGKEVPFQAQNLDRPFWGFFYPKSAYPTWRSEMLPVDDFKRKYPALEAK